MTNTLKLLCVLAHPDDESLGTGGILAWYAAEGIPCGKGDDESWTNLHRQLPHLIGGRGGLTRHCYSHWQGGGCG
jgi:hypothetical protein